MNMYYNELVRETRGRVQGSPGREGTLARQYRAQTHEPRGTGEALEKGDVAGVPRDKRKVATQ